MRCATSRSITSRLAVCAAPRGVAGRSPAGRTCRLRARPTTASSSRPTCARWTRRWLADELRRRPPTGPEDAAHRSSVVVVTVVLVAAAMVAMVLATGTDLPAHLPVGELVAVHVRVRHARLHRGQQLVELARLDALRSRTHDVVGLDRAGDRRRGGR